MDRNEVSKQVTEPQRKFLQQLEYCLCKVSDYMLLDFKIAYEELQLGNVRFIDDNLVLLDVRLPYTVEDVAVFFDADDCSGWATIRFVFSKEKQYAEYDITGYVGDTNNNKAELDFVHFLLELGGRIDPHSPYADRIDISKAIPKDFTTLMADYFADGMK